MRGADLVVRTLTDAGVRTIFTLSGNQIMPIFDACIGSGINLVHVRHEAAAVYMADAWAQLTGQVGVALVTAAPGFANCLSPLYTARASESAVVLLSGDSPTTQDGHGAFQELSQVDISQTLVKAAHRACDPERLDEDVEKAIRIACSGRPGPVHLVMPFDALNAEVNRHRPSEVRSFAREEMPPDASAVNQTRELLAEANNPIVLTGPVLSPSRAGPQVRKLEESLDAPVVCMESPRGLKDPALGDFAKALVKADVILFLGKAVDFSVNFGQFPAVDSDCKFIVTNAESNLIDQAKRNLGDRLVAAYKADIDATAKALVDGVINRSDARNEWREFVGASIATRNQTAGDNIPSSRILPATLCRTVQRVLDAADDPILICDGGEFGQWAQACLSSPTRIINGLAGAIGGILCYAIAAKINRPNATVVSVMGDGTAGFHLSEFETALRCGAPFIGVVGNDARWNAEYQIQLRDYGQERLIGCELAWTRYDLAVAGLGCHGEHVVDALQLDDAFQRAIDSGLPACINVEIEGLPAPAGSAH